MRTSVANAIVFAFFCLEMGCANAGVRQPDWARSSTPGRAAFEETTRMPACRDAGHARPQAAALAAVLMTIERAEWTIVDVRLNEATVEAKACLRGNPSNCALKEFFANASGVLAVTGRERLDMRDDVDRWMIYFERDYNRFCAYSDEILDEELAKYRK